MRCVRLRARAREETAVRTATSRSQCGLSCALWRKEEVCDVRKQTAGGRSGRRAAGLEARAAQRVCSVLLSLPFPSFCHSSLLSLLLSALRVGLAPQRARAEGAGWRAGCWRACACELGVEKATLAGRRGRTGAGRTPFGRCSVFSSPPRAPLPAPLPCRCCRRVFEFEFLKKKKRKDHAAALLAA